MEGISLEIQKSSVRTFNILKCAEANMTAKKIPPGTRVVSVCLEGYAHVLRSNYPLRTRRVWYGQT